MDNSEIKALAEAAEPEVERAKQKLNSRQPRFKTGGENDFALSFWRDVATWINSETQIPEYRTDSRELDTFLSNFWTKEPHLKGVVYSATSIERNRGWTLEGGRNQVNSFKEVLHRASGSGWRHYINQQALAFFSTNLGSLTELGRDGRRGPVRGLYHLDPTRCVLTGDMEYPLKYYPRNGKMQEWEQTDYFRCSSLPSIEERHNELGRCAVFRCYEMARMLLSVHEYDLESLGARAPKGLLLLQNITQDMWDDAMRARDAKLDGEGWQRFGGVAVLASMGELPIDAKLVALSQLPTGLDDRKTFMDLCMFTYALCFGYDPGEFWPVSSGVLGRGVETQVQHQKATAKGGFDFGLTFQEQLQLVLPESLDFQFDQRDTQGELQLAQLASAWAGVANTLYMSGQQVGVPLISQEQAMHILAKSQVVPNEWSTLTEDEKGKDVERMRLWQEEAKDRSSIRRAAETFPREPIIRYSFPAKKEVTLFISGVDLLARNLWPVAVVERSTEEVSDFGPQAAENAAKHISLCLWTGIKMGAVASIGLDENGEPVSGVEVGDVLGNRSITALTNEKLAMFVHTHPDGSAPGGEDLALLVQPSWMHPNLRMVLVVGHDGTFYSLVKRRDVDYWELPQVRSFLEGHNGGIEARYQEFKQVFQGSRTSDWQRYASHYAVVKMAEELALDYVRIEPGWSANGYHRKEEDHDGSQTQPDQTAQGDGTASDSQPA